MKIIRNLLIGFCIGVTILTISIIIGEILMGNMSHDFIEEITMYSIISLFLGLGIGTGISIGEKNKSKDIAEKKKILKSVLIIIFILIIISASVLVLSIKHNTTLAFNIIISLIIGALFLWETGSYIGYKNLKKNE